MELRSKSSVDGLSDGYVRMTVCAFKQTTFQQLTAVADHSLQADLAASGYVSILAGRSHWSSNTPAPLSIGFDWYISHKNQIVILQSSIVTNLILTRRDGTDYGSRRTSRALQLWLKSFFHAQTERATAITTNMLALAASVTPGERLALRWAARGKTARETAIITDKSERNIRFWLTNVQKKLGVFNTAHAIHKAHSIGLIHVERM